MQCGVSPAGLICWLQGFSPRKIWWGGVVSIHLGRWTYIAPLLRIFTKGVECGGLFLLFVSTFVTSAHQFPSGLLFFLSSHHLGHFHQE